MVNILFLAGQMANYMSLTENKFGKSEKLVEKSLALRGKLLESMFLRY